MVCTSTDSSDCSSSSSSSESESEFEAVNEKEINPQTQSVEKNAEKVDKKKNVNQKRNSEIGKGKQNKEKKQRKKEEKSVRVLRRAITKHKLATQKVNKKLALALRYVGSESRKHLSDLNKLKRKKV